MADNLDKFPDIYYPVQGSRKFQTVSIPMTKAFRVDFGAMTASSTSTALNLPKGAFVYGWIARVVEAFNCGTTGGTIQMGFTSSPLISAALTTANLGTVGKIVGPKYLNGGDLLSANLTVWIPLVCTAVTPFRIINATAAPSAGKVDVFLTYTPLPSYDLDTEHFTEYVTT